MPLSSLSLQLPLLKMGCVIYYYTQVFLDDTVSMARGRMEIKGEHQNLDAQTILLLLKKWEHFSWKVSWCLCCTADCIF